MRHHDGADSGQAVFCPLDPRVRQGKLCREKIYLSSTVQTGIRRTGSLFAFQQYDIQAGRCHYMARVLAAYDRRCRLAADTCCNVLTPGGTSRLGTVWL